MKLQNFVITAVLTAVSVSLSTLFSPVLSQEKPALLTAQNSQNLPNSTGQPNISIKNVFYTVEGSTPQEIRTSLNKLRPQMQDSNNHKRYDAYTQWFVKWNYFYQTQNNRCLIKTAQVNADIITTMPKWKVNSKASKSVKNQWERYIVALKQHEEGHQKNGINASKEILKTINNLPDYSSCTQLGTAVNAASNRIIKKYNQKDLEYDRITQHGATQGATFP